MAHTLRGELYATIIKELNKQGITIENMAELVYESQLPYVPDVTMQICISSVEHVLSKREVQNAIMTGLELDRLSREHLLSEPLQTIVEQDSGTYGVDEVIGMGISNVFGSIAVSNYFHLDKTKEGIVGELNKRKFTVFIDDIVGAIIGSAEARIAHKYADNTWEK